MRVLLSWSGGKDSSLTLAALRADPRYEVVALLTSITRGYDRISIHGVRRELLEAQAASIGLPLIEIPLEPKSSNDQYEAAFLESLEHAREMFPGLRLIAFGDLFLEDVRAYRERLVEGAGWEPLFPIWRPDTGELAREFITAGYAAHLVCVDTNVLSADFAGRRFDARLLEDLPEHVDPCGERGEFHTFVSAGPIFGKPIAVRTGEVVLREERFAYCDLLPASRSTLVTEGAVQ
jgi:uncharacterized protein (TIGR00290 family)